MKILLRLQILVEPKHALGKQYKKLVSMNNVRNSIFVCVIARVFKFQLLGKTESLLGYFR